MKWLCLRVVFFVFFCTSNCKPSFCWKFVK